MGTYPRWRLPLTCFRHQTQIFYILSRFNFNFCNSFYLLQDILLVNHLIIATIWIKFSQICNHANVAATNTISIKLFTHVQVKSMLCSVENIWWKHLSDELVVGSEVFLLKEFLLFSLQSSLTEQVQTSQKKIRALPIEQNENFCRVTRTICLACLQVFSRFDRWGLEEPLDIVLWC